MKKILNTLTFFVLLNVINGQVTQIIVTSIEQTDKTINKKDKLFLKNQATKNQIIYTIDTLTKNLTTKKYLVETFYSIWDGDTITKTKIKQKYKKWKHKITPLEWKNILIALKTNVDSLNKDESFLHTSHHYLKIKIDVINNKDTVSYLKTKPFEYETPWWTKENFSISVLNPSIDIQIAQHLPEKFICRKELVQITMQNSSQNN